WHRFRARGSVLQDRYCRNGRGRSRQARAQTPTRQGEGDGGGLMSSGLECISVSKHFGAVKAVNDVSFTVAPGALHAIIGPNGAGKTTLFNCITSELEPTSGEVRFEGHVISGRRPHDLPAFGVARSFQRTSIFSNLTVA